VNHVVQEAIVPRARQHVPVPLDLSVGGSAVVTGAGITGSALMVARGVPWTGSAARPRRCKDGQRCGAGGSSEGRRVYDLGVDSKWSGVAADEGRTWRLAGGNCTGQQAMAVESREMQDAVAGSQQLANGRRRGRGCGGGVGGAWSERG
jgi:hypothetical protein